MRSHTIPFTFPSHRLRGHTLLRSTASAAAASPPSFAYVANYGPNDVSIYSLAATGTLSPHGTVRAGMGPRSITIHPSGRFVYVTNVGSFNLTTYAIDATGQLAERGIAVVILEPARAMAIHPSGRSAYVPWYQQIFQQPHRSGLRQYTIDDTGILSLAADITTGHTHFPHAVAVDPSGQFLYVVNGGDQVHPEYDTVSMFRTDALTGTVTTILGTVPTGRTPEAMTVDPTGHFAYVVNSGSNDVSMYAIETTTGQLLPQGTVEAGREPLAITVDPTSRFVYVANHGSNDVSMYTLEATTGRLRLQGTVVAGTFPWSVALDPTGHFAYVVNHGVNTIAMYAIEATTGQLIPGETVRTQPKPAAVSTVTPQALWLFLNATTFKRGATLTLAAVITPWPTLTRVDLYLALQLPDATVVFVRADGTFASEPQPYIANWEVVPFHGELVRSTVGHTAPVGHYRWLALFTDPGTETLIGTIAQAPFLVSP
jgi:6-phosphogluconolactonase (cycloisomerase 2 family)